MSIAMGCLGLVGVLAGWFAWRHRDVGVGGVSEDEALILRLLDDARDEDATDVTDIKSRIAAGETPIPWEQAKKDLGLK